MPGVVFTGDRTLELMRFDDPTPGRGEVASDVSPDMLRRQATVIASWTFSTIGQAECARFVVDRGIDVDALFTDRWRLDRAADAYGLFDRQTGGKGVFLS